MSTRDFLNRFYDFEKRLKTVERSVTRRRELAVARVRKTSNTSMDSGSWVTVDFDQVLVDTHDMWDVSNPTRLTVPTDGLYDIEAHGSVTLGGAEGNRQVQIRVNDSYNIDFVRISASPSSNTHIRGNALAVPLEAGDFVEAEFLQNSGSTLTLNSHNPYSPRLVVVQRR